MKLHIDGDKLIYCETDFDYEDIKIPDTVKEICTLAFANLKIGEITIPNTVKEMQADSFRNCKITILNVKPSILNLCYHSNSIITDSQIDVLHFHGIIAPKSFCYSCEINSLIFDDTNAIISSNCIERSKVKNLTFSKNLEVIDALAFYLSKVPNEITFPATLKVLRELAFFNYNPKTNFKFENETLFVLGSNAIPNQFTNNIDIKEVDNLIIADKIYYKHFKGPINIPDNISMIYDNACITLNNELIEIPASVKIIGERAFAGSIYLNTVKLHSKDIAIGPNAFELCTSLTNINLENVNLIGTCAFQETSLEEVTITKKTNTIGCAAFKECQRLKNITLLTDNFKNFDLPIADDHTQLSILKKVYKAHPGMFTGETKIDFIDKSLDELLNEGKTISEINNIYKRNEEIIEDK